MNTPRAPGARRRAGARRARQAAVSATLVQARLLLARTGLPKEAMPDAGAPGATQDQDDLESAWNSVQQSSWLATPDVTHTAAQTPLARFTPNSARFEAVLRAAEDFLGGGACRTQVLLTTLQDGCWHEVPGAFAVAIFRACAVSTPRASLGAEFSKIVDLVVLSACGSLRHDAIHSWVLSNWNVFVRGLVEVLLEMLDSDELTLQPAREARARRAFRVTIELAGAVRKYMALDALKSSNGVHALLAVCDNDSGSGSLLQSGYYWEHETQISLMSDKQRLKLKASAYAPMCYAHVIFMEEVAAAIERAEPGLNDINTWKTAFGFFASSTLWRQFARRCRVYARCKNRQMLKAKIAMRISPLEATNALLKRIEGACDVVRASARYKARQEIKRKLEAAETTDATSESCDDTPPRPTRIARRACYQKPPSRESSADSNASTDSNTSEKNWLENLFDEAFPESGTRVTALRGNGTSSPVPCSSLDERFQLVGEAHGVPADDGPSLPDTFNLPTHYNECAEPTGGEEEEDELNFQIERSIERATDAFDSLRGLAAKGVETAQRLDNQGFSDDEWYGVVKKFQESNMDNWKADYRDHVRPLGPCILTM